MQPNESAGVGGGEGPCAGTPPPLPPPLAQAPLPPLPLPPYWAERARREVNEDPDAARDNVLALRKKVLEESNLFARTDDTFLLAFLRARKHNVEEAFKVLKNFYELRSKYPSYTEDCLPSEKSFFYDQNSISVLEERDQHERTIVTIHVVKEEDLDDMTTAHFLQLLLTVHQLLVEDPLVQVAGVVFIVDFTGFSLRHARIFSPSFVRVSARFMQDSFPIRTQAVHVIFEPFFFDAVYALFKPFLKAKLRKRIHMHGWDTRSLLAALPARALPEALGGCGRGWNFAAYRAAVARNEHLFREWRRYGYGKSETDHRQETSR